MFPAFPRMLVWFIATLVLMALALLLQAEAPGNLVAVTLYKAHLLSLGGWGGYWLDRALFPYDRPHEYLADKEPDIDDGGPYNEPQCLAIGVVSGYTLGNAMIRRSIIVAACLITVGLGA